VDTRERAVMDQLRALGVPFDVSALPVGDFCVAPFVFERKTPGDLAASLADGRFREQRDRMETAAAEGMRPVYLLESRAPFAADERTRGAVCSLAERGIAVIPTRDARIPRRRSVRSSAAAGAPPGTTTRAGPRWLGRRSSGARPR